MLAFEDSMNTRLFPKLLLPAELLVLGGMLLATLVCGGFESLFSWTTWGTMSAAAAVTALVIYFVSRQITRPVAEMMEGVNAIAGRNFDHRFRASVSDEFERLSGALEQLRQAVSQRYEELENVNDRLLTILQSMVEGVLAVDNGHRILHANKASRRLLRLTTPDVIGRPLLEATRFRPLHDAVVQALSRPGPVTTELHVGDDPKRQLMLRAMRFPGDPCPGVVVVLHDVTELRRLENLRREFVANVSHELKTPLASIKAYAETLREGAVNDAANNLIFVERIEEDANRLHQLITDMLQIARVESHQQAFNFTRVDIGEVVQRCVAQMTPRAAAKNLDLEFEPPAEPLQLLADQEGVHTILANLVDNAIKYTPKGRVRILWWGENDSLVLRVEDTGVGIEMENQRRIFERFFRVDVARNRDVGGTGLGLSIVKHLVQAFQGSVSVISKPGEGSTFEVRLPLFAPEKVSA